MLIWVAVTIVSVIIKASKAKPAQMRTGNAARRPSIEDIMEQMQKSDKMAAEKKKAGGKRAPATAPVVEGERTTSEVEPTTAETAATDSVDLDFDPVKMVIYSEIMEPGYEKY